jgi:thiamine biosynthesis lipoprotein
MGVDTKLVVYTADEAHARTACRAAFDRIAELEQIMSDYRPTSELMQLCAKSGGPPVPISPDLHRVLSTGQQIAAQSQGAFDMTLGPLTQLWRATRKSQQLPSLETLQEARSRTGYQNLLVLPSQLATGNWQLATSPPTAQLLQPNMLLDLGGIAKGDAGDQALATLHHHGIPSALYQAGGDIVLSNPPPNTQGWTITIPHSPDDEFKGQAATGNGQAKDQGGPSSLPSSLAPRPSPLAPSPSSTLLLSNCAISTSGDTTQHVTIDNTRYSHLLDPRTGLGLTTRTLATVIAPKGLLADPLSKAASLLPPDELRQLLTRHPHTTIYTRTVPIGEE